MSHTSDILIIGGGIFGVTAAVELARRRYAVTLINPDTIPHHLAASTDVTKAVRMEYGADTEYFRMVEECIDGWHAWNALFGETLYHETGFLMLCRDALDSERQSFERESCRHLAEAGYPLDHMDATALQERYPVVNADTYPEANYNPRAGYVASGRVVEVLAGYARSLGVRIVEGQTARQLLIDRGKLTGVRTREGQTFSCGHALVAAGAHTPLLVPELGQYMRATGHPVFWVVPPEPQRYTPPHFPVFTADISNTGWYGFPYLPGYGVVKIARHSNGLTLDPERDDRRVTDAEIDEFRVFLRETFPDLAEAPIVYTRRCLYTDTLDGHFWIDRHPQVEGLSVSSGGSGHGMKMAPLLGALAVDRVEGKTHRYGQRHLWRHLSPDTEQVEQARFVKNRTL